MGQNKRYPYIAESSTVGVTLQDMLQTREMKQSELADLTGVKTSVICDVIKGNRSMTSEMAVLFESALGISADYLMMTQVQEELEKARQSDKVVDQTRLMDHWSVIKEHVSLSILKKFNMLSGNIQDRVNEVLSMFHSRNIEDFVAIACKEKEQVYFKKSEKLRVDSGALFTWKYYCLDQASKYEINTQYDKKCIDSLVEELRRIFLDNNNTYQKTKDAFEKNGIRLLYIKKEGQVPVDGMSFWNGSNPTVVITRRLHNIDNFAFACLHELGHLKFHLTENSEAMINIDSSDRDEVEAEADIFARNAFVSQERWIAFMERNKSVNPYAIHKKIEELSNELSINPQILYGRYMFETGLYRLRRVFPVDVN